MELTTLIEIYGAPGVIIFGLGWYALSERKERQAAQQTAFETLKEVLPAVAALQAALLHIKEGSNE